jgi:DNA polymerase V
MEEQFYSSAYSGKKQMGSQSEQKATNRGFGMPSQESLSKDIDLNEQLIRNKSATYFFRMKGDAMKDAGIFDNDILVVDRSIKNAVGKVVVVILNGETLVRRFHKNFSSAFLIPENDRFKTINLAEFAEFTVWGVVTHTIHSFD